MRYQSYQDKKMIARYSNVDPSYVPHDIRGWAELMKWNPGAYQKARLLQNKIDNDRKKLQKLVAEAECGIVNLAIGVKNPTHWFPCDRSDLPEPSVAEQLMIDQLNRYDVVWYREVSFYGLKFTDYGYARYDILIQVLGNVHIIEYDSEKWHSAPENIVKDNMKTAFCNTHGIPITRYNKKDYYHMEHRIAELMKQYKIRKK